MNITQVISKIVLFHRRYLHGKVYLRIAACTILAGLFSSPHLAAATTVRMETSLGVIDIELYDEQAPKTVANFLRYAGRRDYSDNGFFHRSAKNSTGANFVLQGGGYVYGGEGPFGSIFFHIPEDPPVQNEFSPLQSNIRGTVAMAKLPVTDDQGKPIPGGGPDSATSEWFFNLADNSANLDYQNGGYTVFGRVIAGMNIVDAIANLPTWNASLGPFKFPDLPLINNVSQRAIQPATDLVFVTRTPNVTATKTLVGTTSVFTADIDMTFSPASTIDQASTASRLAAFTQPANKTILFNSGGILTFTVTGAKCQTACIVTLIDGNSSPSTHYYGYGPTPDNSAAHWYDFSFDVETGAEFVNGKILLHFVDGKRGDDDLTVNGSVTHTGISAVTLDFPTSSTQPGGCTITAMSSQTTGNGDWIVITMFFAFVALIRKRTRND